VVSRQEFERDYEREVEEEEYYAYGGHGYGHGYGQGHEPGSSHKGPTASGMTAIYWGKKAQRYG